MRHNEARWDIMIALLSFVVIESLPHNNSWPGRTHFNPLCYCTEPHGHGLSFKLLVNCPIHTFTLDVMGNLHLFPKGHGMVKSENCMRTRFLYCVSKISIHHFRSSARFKFRSIVRSMLDLRAYQIFCLIYRLTIVNPYIYRLSLPWYNSQSDLFKWALLKPCPPPID